MSGILPVLSMLICTYALTSHVIEVIMTDCHDLQTRAASDCL
jgi:hypothetical protein